MTKNCPVVIPISFGLKNCIASINSDHDETTNHAIVKSEVINIVDKVIDLNIQMAKNAIEIQNLDIDCALKNIKKDQIGIQGAKIEGDFIDYIKLMMKKQKSNNRTITGEVIVLDSYDGDEHYTSNQTKASITSYSSQIFAKSMENNKNESISTAESFNIMTWQQILADEKLDNIISVVEIR